MVEAVTAGIQGSVNLETPFPNQVLQKLLERISKGLERNQISLSEKEREALCSEIREIELEMAGLAKANPLKLDKKQLWSYFLESQGIALCLLMSEVNGYSAVYFAYENFLIRSVKVAKGLRSLRTENLPKNLRELLGASVVDECWNNRQVKLARLIRHALVHNGRKITEELQKYRDELMLQNDEITIMAYHTTELYNLLKARAYLLASEMKKLPLMQ